MDGRAASKTAELQVRNVGGIDSTEVTFEPGVTVLAGRNATNRTSLLRAVMVALGSDTLALKSDAERGEVELTVGGETYTRTLVRDGTTVRAEGEPYLENAELADLFAFLLESNPAREAVARGDNLREVIMEPIDTAEIQRQIRDLKTERRELETELEDLEEEAKRLPGLEEKRQRLTDEIEEKREQLETLEAEIEASEVDPATADGDDEALEAKLAELRSTRSSLEDVRYRLETERESLASLEEELASLEVDDVDPDDLEEELEWLDSQLSRLRTRKNDVDLRLDDLQSIIKFNEETLDERDSRTGEERGSVTDRLVEEGSQQITCWTCGTDVDRERIEETIGDLRGLRQDLLEDRKEIQADIDEYSDRKRDLESTLSEHERAVARQETLRTEKDDRESRIEDLEAEADEIEAEIETLEAEVEELQDEERSEVVDRHKEANDLEFELGRTQERLESVESEIASIERRLDERDGIEDRLEEVKSEIAALRTRVEDVEREAVEKFNQHMDEILEVLGYSNIERVWIERRKNETGRGQSDSTFELHIVRTTDDGKTYEDVLENLSESEREIIGLVFGLAGYLVHDVHETVPFMLLDSLEAIDAERIAKLVEYLSAYVEHLVVALLTEDAAAIDEEHRRIEEI
ncbi:archaea-specific SMC-related protein [Natrialbaceae archaeon A-gly3]